MIVSPKPQPRPNVVVIFTNDLDWDEVASLASRSEWARGGIKETGNKKVLTPNIDKLRGRKSFVHPVSRGFDGLHVRQVAQRRRRQTRFSGAPADCRQIRANMGRKIPNFLPTKRASARPMPTPRDIWHEAQGFDFVSSIYMGNGADMGLPSPLTVTEHNMEWFTAGSLKFLDEQKQGAKPFFLYLAPNVPHGSNSDLLKADPRATPAGLVNWHLGLQPPREDVLKRKRQAGVPDNLSWTAWLDDSVGAVMKKIDDMGIADNTIVMFTSDHQTRGKWEAYEGALVPLMVRWPGKIKPGINETLLSSVDIVPTILELTGSPLPDSKTAILDGRSFAPVLAGGTISAKPTLIEMGYARGIVSGDWKYIATRLPEKVKTEAKIRNETPSLVGTFTDNTEAVPLQWFPSFGAIDELFDLKNDPAQAAKLAEMRVLLKDALAPLPHVFGEFKTNPTLADNASF